MNRLALALAGASLVQGCNGCTKREPAVLPVDAAVVTAEAPQAPARCHVDGARLALPGDDVIVGEAVVTADAVFVGVVRREGAKRLASIVRAPLDLARAEHVELGPSFGDDPPPRPHLRGNVVAVSAFKRRTEGDSAAQMNTRWLEIARIDPGALAAEGGIAQQADESLAYDVAWRDGDKSEGLVAWDEDAQPGAAHALGDRGVVKVQRVGASTTKARVASPETSDAESPRLAFRPGGYWLAWIAGRPEAIEDAGKAGRLEGPGEARSYRWVEFVSLDEKGEPASAVRRITPMIGHVASFDLVRTADAQLEVLVHDEAAHAEGAGGRITRYAIGADKSDGVDVVDAGVGRSTADLVPQANGDAWLSFVDLHERAHLVSLGAGLRPSRPESMEPALDGARILGARAPDSVYAVGPTDSEAGSGRLELRRLVCR